MTRENDLKNDQRKNDQALTLPESLIDLHEHANTKRNTATNATHCHIARLTDTIEDAAQVREAA